MIRQSHVVLLGLLVLSLLGAPTLPAAAQEGTPAAECVQTTPQENEALASRYWDEIWTTGGDAAVAELLAPDEIHHWGIAGDTTDLDAFTERLLLFLAAFPDIDFTIDESVAEGDLAATYWTATGTQSGEWQGIAPTGREVTWQGVNVFRFQCGLIAESWGEADHIGLRQQLGAPDVPPMASPVAMPAVANADATPCAGDTPEGNVAVARRWTEDVINHGNLAALDEILAPNVVHHGATFSAVQGIDGVKQALQRVITAFPETLTIEQTIAEGDLVAVRYAGTGTHEGDYFGVPATGKTVQLSGINLYRIDCGRIVESWSKINGLDLLRQVTA